MIESGAAPRGRFLRTVLAGLLGLAVILGSVGPETFVEKTTGNEYLGWLVSGILPFLVGAWLAPDPVPSPAAAPRPAWARDVTTS